MKIWNENRGWFVRIEVWLYMWTYICSLRALSQQWMMWQLQFDRWLWSKQVTIRGRVWLGDYGSILMATFHWWRWMPLRQNVVLVQLEEANRHRQLKCAFNKKIAQTERMHSGSNSELCLQWNERNTVQAICIKIIFTCTVPVHRKKVLFKFKKIFNQRECNLELRDDRLHKYSKLEKRTQ